MKRKGNKRSHPFLRKKPAASEEQGGRTALSEALSDVMGSKADEEADVCAEDTASDPAKRKPTVNVRPRKKEPRINALSKSYLRKVSTDVRSELASSYQKFPDGEINVGSLFSGSEIQRLCGEGLTDVVNGGFKYNCFAASD